MVDANQAWTRDEAARMVPRLERYELAWLEEPLRADRPSLIALSRRKDQHHARAVDIAERHLGSGGQFVGTTLILAEFHSHLLYLRGAAEARAAVSALLDEIESVLHAMPGVADCAVFGIPDAEFGEALGAAVQPSPGATLDAASVQAFLRERIANYKVPRWVEFHEALPREVDRAPGHGIQIGVFEASVRPVPVRRQDTRKIFKRLLREPHWRSQSRAI